MIIGETEAQNAYEKHISEGLILASQKDRVLYEHAGKKIKYSMGNLLEGLPENSTIRAETAIMLNNMRTFFDTLDESTRLVNIGDFEKHAFPLVRVIYPNLAAHNLCSVQTMNGPLTLVFYMKILYGTTKGSAVAGTDAIENPNQYYGSEDVDEEELGTGDGIVTAFTGNLTWLPVKPGTFKATSVASGVAVEVTDDGNGNIIGDIGAGTNTINYTSGAYNFDFVGAPDLNEEVNAAYTYDAEGHTGAPELTMQLTSSPVRARTHRLRTQWSMEAEQDLRALHGLEAEVEMTSANANELKFEIDRTLIDAMYNIAFEAIPVWSRTPGTNISYTEHKLGFNDTLTRGSNAIFTNTQRAVGTWIVCGINMASVIETMPGFVGKSRPKNTRGVYQTGTLNGQWEIWKDPNMSTNTGLMGFKGDNMWTTGYIFAPYILGYATKTYQHTDFQSHKGMASRFGRKAVDSKFFCTLSIS